MINGNCYGIGMMSGTSLDGVDLVYVRFNSDQHDDFEIIHTETIAYDENWLTIIKDAFYAGDDLEEVDRNYGVFLGELASEFIAKHKITKVDFIASHGHTIFHQPEKGYTLQIGAGQQISNTTKLKVISDFRTQDVKLGGQGAPLVPMGDQLLFGEFSHCLNLGGFANISFNQGNERIAYDICAVNIILNHYVSKLGFGYDDKGKIASGGSIDKNLLEALNNLPYYSEKPPKSLGFEWVQSTVIPLIDHSTLSEPDILRTYVEHVALQIADQLQGDGLTLLITGGGALNDFLVSRINHLTNAKIHIPKNEIIEYKEALIFALLGLLKLQGKVNVLSSVTGAQRDHSSGKISVPIN